MMPATRRAPSSSSTVATPLAEVSVRAPVSSSTMADDEVLALWREVQLMHLQLTAVLHRGLVADVGLSYQDFVVLSELSIEPRRVVDLARTVGIEKSRLSHHLDRMQARE